jgi:hypothetical protein
MVGLFKYKAFSMHWTHPFCNAALFSAFFFNPNPHDVEFDDLFRRLFGDRATSSDLYADLQREVKIYHVMGTISVLPCLPKLVEQYLVPRLFPHEQPDDMTQSALAQLLDARIEIYTQTAGQLSLKETIGEGAYFIRLLKTNETYQTLVSLKQLNQSQQMALRESPTLTLETAQEMKPIEDAATAVIASIMTEIWQLTDDFLKRHQRSPFRGVYLKYWDVRDIRVAQTPEEVMNLLHQKHDIHPFVQKKRYEVLVMNEEPSWLWWVKTVLIALTLPVSVPALMIYSWAKGGTFDFTKTEGALYLEKILSLCKEAGVEVPTSFPESETAIEASNSSSTAIGWMPPFIAAEFYFTEAELQAPPDPRVALAIRGDYEALEALEALQALSNRPPDLSAYLLPITPAPAATATSTSPVAPATAVGDPLIPLVNGLTNTLSTCIAAMRANPAMLFVSEALRNKGQAVFLSVPPFQNQPSPYYVLQPFTYASVWTKPWDQLDGFNSQIILFRRFSFMRRVRKTNKSPVNVVIAADAAEAKDSSHWLSGLLPPPDDYRTLMQKARDERWVKLYLAAISVAENNTECTDALEGLINLDYEMLEDWKTKKEAYDATPESRARFNRYLQVLEREHNEYIDLLPEGYQECSTTAKTLQACFDQVWVLIERGDLRAALKVFGYELGLSAISVKGKIQQLIETHFVQACLPHLVCMWYQLRAIFFLKGEHPAGGFSDEEEGKKMLYYMGETLKHLEANHIPEATAFKRECMIPLQQMQEHVETLFRAVPKQTTIRYTKERYRDSLDCQLKGVSDSYRYENRGQRHTYSNFFDTTPEEKRRMIRVVDEQLRRESEEDSNPHSQIELLP